MSSPVARLLSRPLAVPPSAARRRPPPAPRRHPPAAARRCFCPRRQSRLRCRRRVLRRSVACPASVFVAVVASRSRRRRHRRQRRQPGGGGGGGGGGGEQGSTGRWKVDGGEGRGGRGGGPVFVDVAQFGSSAGTWCGPGLFQVTPGLGQPRWWALGSARLRSFTFYVL